MTLFLSRRGAVEPFHALDVLAEANRLRTSGADVVSLAVGQPSDPAPECVREAAAKALQDGRIGYTDALGLPVLRATIARHYGDHYGLDIAPSRIAVTTGSSAGFNLAFLGMFEAGDRIAITEPGYPAYRNILFALGLEAVEIPVGDTGYLTGATLASAHADRSFKGVLFASPANPTGAVIPADELEALLAVARELGIAVISDEIYHRLSFSAPDTTALAFDDRVTVVNSFSKYYCMTGWRIGWMVLPEEQVRQIERLQQSLYISAPELSQHGAARAFEASEALDGVKERYRVNREMLLQRLPGLGFELAAPMDGAFYAYCDISRHSNDSMEFARRMLAEAHVAATPGIDFDTRQGNRYMRLSYAGSPEAISLALDRLDAWLKT